MARPKRPISKKQSQSDDKPKGFAINPQDFLDNDENEEENFENLKSVFHESNIQNDQQELSKLLRLISTISENHIRSSRFFSKIERIIQLFKDDIKKHYSNSEIFNIFSKSKRVLLFLIEEQIITLDEFIVKKITSYKYYRAFYPQYFLPEIDSFIKEKWIPEHIEKENEKEEEELSKKIYNNFHLLVKYLSPEIQSLCKTKEDENDYDDDELHIKITELPVNFNELRKLGENDSYICKLIREDSIQEFIAYLNKNGISPNEKIEPSIYETNSFFFTIDDYMTLIEYAAFYGAIQIFRYLKREGIKMNKSLLINSIHNKNAELIHLIEENFDEKLEISDKEKLYNECLEESIKCHHNDIADYIIYNHLNENKSHFYGIKYFNFNFIQNNHIDEMSFFDFCKYGYINFVNIYLMDSNINLNNRKIYFKEKMYEILYNQNNFN